jgi:hypothetical protein
MERFNPFVDLTSEFAEVFEESILGIYILDSLWSLALAVGFMDDKEENSSYCAELSSLAVMPLA